MHANSSLHAPQHRRRRTPLSLLGALAALMLAGLTVGVSGASAQSLLGAIEAHLTAGASATCPTTTLSEPFLTWGDENSYSLVPGGSFEGSSSEWTLSGGAKQAPGSETFAATGALGSSSLALPARASAQSPFVCISSVEGAFRFFARSEASASLVTAEVVYKTSLGNIVVPVGIVAAKSGWAPSPKFTTIAGLGTAIAGGTVQMALRFTAISGAARIDDVFIDPRMRK